MLCTWWSPTTLGIAQVHCSRCHMTIEDVVHCASALLCIAQVQCLCMLCLFYSFACFALVHSRLLLVCIMHLCNVTNSRCFSYVTRWPRLTGIAWVAHIRPCIPGHAPVQPSDIEASSAREGKICWRCSLIPTSANQKAGHIPRYLMPLWFCVQLEGDDLHTLVIPWL